MACFVRRQSEPQLTRPCRAQAADIIKLAMINVDNWLRTNKLKSRMIMQVHDELVLEVPESEHHEVICGSRNAWKTPLACRLN
jgi:hypothetical protein